MAEIEQPLIPQESSMDTGALPIPPYTPPDLTKPHKPQSLAPTTTVAEDETVAGQRKINLIWEITQAFIAVIVVLSNMTAAIYNVFKDRPVDVPMILSSSLFLIIGFYFSRTNHAQIGGLGEKATDTQQYKGR